MKFKLAALVALFCGTLAGGGELEITLPSPAGEVEVGLVSTDQARWLGGPKFADPPFELDGLEAVIFGADRPEEISIKVSSRVNAYLLIDQDEQPELSERWIRTTIQSPRSDGGTDAVYAHEFQPGDVRIPLLPALKTPVALVLEPME